MNNKILRKIVKLRNFFDIKKDSDKEHTISYVADGIYLRGNNIWYLISSAVIASIGLDTNSTAVIIGAMLISPLMNPILGIGLGFGVHDRELLLNSLRQFSIAVIISFLISYVYFLITPIGTATSELLARTKPTLLDVGVAFFGGLAGIVASSRKSMAVAIPGVAIATALMPPICSSGYGLAIANMSIFFGALYLFFINAMFISLAVYIIVRYLKFPYKTYLERARKQRMRRLVAFVLILFTIPSIIIFAGIINEIRIKNNIALFINNHFKNDKISVVDYNLAESDSIKTLTIYTVGELLSGKSRDSLSRILSSYQDDVKLYLIQMESGELTNLHTMEIFKDTEYLMRELSLMQRKVDSLTAINKRDSLSLIKINNDFKFLYPGLDSIIITDKSDTNAKVSIFWKSRSRNIQNENMILFLLKEKLNVDSIKVEINK